VAVPMNSAMSFFMSSLPKRPRFAALRERNWGASPKTILQRNDIGTSRGQLLLRG
jgi:hypothetical protein